MANNFPLSPGSMLKFVGKGASGAIVSWVATQGLNAAFGNDTTEALKEISDKLDEVIQTQERIMKQLNGLSLQIDWQSTLIKGFSYANSIDNWYSRLQDVFKDGNTDENRTRADQLKIGILDTNDGICSVLGTLHRVIMGKESLDPNGKGLIELWAANCHAKLTNDFSVTIDDYRTALYDYLAMLFSLQLKGLSLYLYATTPASASESFLNEVQDNMHEQNEEFFNVVPPLTHFFPDHPEVVYTFFSRNEQQLCYKPIPMIGEVMRWGVPNQDGNVGIECQLIIQGDGTYQMIGFGSSAGKSARWYKRPLFCDRAGEASYFRIIPILSGNKYTMAAKIQPYQSTGDYMATDYWEFRSYRDDLNAWIDQALEGTYAMNKQLVH